jgi:hypothetical protein
MRSYALVQSRSSFVLPLEVQPRQLWIDHGDVEEELGEVAIDDLPQLGRHAFISIGQAQAQLILRLEKARSFLIPMSIRIRQHERADIATRGLANPARRAFFGKDRWLRL